MTKEPWSYCPLVLCIGSKNQISAIQKRIQYSSHKAKRTFDCDTRLPAQPAQGQYYKTLTVGKIGPLKERC